jgi:hypothetical protein
MLYDLFICHASEDKDSFVRPLADALRVEHVEVWYDESSLKLGDSIRRSLDKGLLQSRFGVVVLSKAFFAKQWPQYELDGLAECEMRGQDKIPITPLADIVLEFIDDHPGLYEICEMFPTLLVEYAPQLTIPGMGGEFERIFERLYRISIRKHAKMRSEGSSQGCGLTINKKCPLCDEEWALRHPTFGDYKAVHVTNEYFRGGMLGPPVSPYEHADHAFWLLSKASSWMPETIREFLIDGMANWHDWLWWEYSVDKGGLWKTSGSLATSLFDAAEGKAFKWNTDIRDDVIHRIEMAIATLHLPDTSQEILDRFLNYDFPAKYIQSGKRRKSEN